MRHPYFQNYRQQQTLEPGEQRVQAHEHIKRCNEQRVRTVNARVLPVSCEGEEGCYHAKG